MLPKPILRTKHTDQLQQGYSFGFGSGSSFLVLARGRTWMLRNNDAFLKNGKHQTEVKDPDNSMINNKLSDDYTKKLSENFHVFIN